MARLWVDENLGFFVPSLRDAGHDVFYAGQTGPGRSDVWHFREALDDQRIILTLDSGFYFLHGLWTTLETLRVVQIRHAGILTAVQTKEFAVPGWLPVVQEKLATGELFDGRMLTWHTAEGEWRPDIRLPWKGLI